MEDSGGEEGKEGAKWNLIYAKGTAS